MNKLSPQFLKSFLDNKFSLFNKAEFVLSDPISVPHSFSNKKDIEVAAFLTSTISWGQRITIINNAKKLMSLMDDAPHDFILHHQPKDLKPFEKFVHRTFNSDDCLAYLHSLQNIYRNHGGLESTFSKAFSDSVNTLEAIEKVRNIFFSTPHLPRTQKHFSSPAKNSATKRLNMFLRWMVRPADGIDFGLWNAIPACKLIIPLDIHVSRAARKLNLIKTKQDNWKAAVELTEELKKFDENDPIKYDIALFNWSVCENLKFCSHSKEIKALSI